MAHKAHNRPKGSGIFLILVGILIFIFAPSHFKNNLAGGVAIMLLGFILGGVGFYIAFLRKN